MKGLSGQRVPGEAGTPRLVGSHLIDEAHSNRHARLLHLHEDELELFYVYSGEGQYVVDSCVYQVQQGDMVICNAGVLHGEDPKLGRRMRSYSIALTDVRVDGLPDNDLTAADSMSVVHCGALSEQIGEMMRLIYLLQNGGETLGGVCQHTALALLCLVQELLKSRERHKGEKANAAAGLTARRVQKYLDAHYQEPMTLQSIGEAMGVSEYHAAHVFRSEIGTSPMQYVMKRRMGEAQTLLMDTNLSIAEIADRLGYGNPWNFSTAFRKCVGMPPSQYRQTFHEMRDGCGRI